MGNETINKELFHKEQARLEQSGKDATAINNNVNKLVEFFKNRKPITGKPKSGYMKMIKANPYIDIMSILNKDFELSSTPSIDDLKLKILDENKQLKKHIKLLEKHIIKMEK